MKAKSLLSSNPLLASEWHPQKNESLTPEMVSAHSNKKVWWLGACGHEWPATVDSRASGKGCPYCSGQKVLPGFNDLETRVPALVSEWDNEANLPLTPQMVSPGSHKKVFWICKKCGNKWPAEIKSRVAGQGCPKCGRQERGNTFRKNRIKAGAKTLAEEHPEIADEWHPTLNAPYLPSDYTSYSGAEVFWHCKKCGSDWRATINNRVGNQSGCPVCSGNAIKRGYNDLQTIDPELASEWHPTRNYPLTPQTVGASSNKNIWWICRFGHEYRCRIVDRRKGVGCSECSKRFRTSLTEQTIRFYISRYYDSVLSGYRPSFLNGAEIDIYIPEEKTGIEYDGQQYHKNVRRDQKKDALCAQNGITLIRIREPNCPVIIRDDPTIILSDLSDASLSEGIDKLIICLGIKDAGEIDVAKDKRAIISFFRDSAISGSVDEVFPSLAQEWDIGLNEGLLPSNIPATYSKDKYYWKCKKCGYSWSASLGERIRGSSCPVCAGKIIVPGINDLATTHKWLAEEWHPDKNKPLTAKDVSKGSAEKVWWKCSKCGNEWAVRIKNRVNGAGCPKCSNKRHAEHQYKSVYQFTLDNTLVREYPSARIAATETGLSRSAIQHACTGRQKTAGGYIWKYSLE